MTRELRASERVLLKHIASNIRDHYGEYKKAGEWLDRYYDDDELCWKKYENELFKKISEIKKKKILTDLDKEDLSYYEMELSKKEKPNVWQRLSYALEDLWLEYREIGVLAEDDAKAILIIAWLASNPQANESPSIITKFADSPWKAEEGEQFVRSGLLYFLFFDSKPVSFISQFHDFETEDYFKLVSVSWQTLFSNTIEGAIIIKEMKRALIGEERLLGLDGQENIEKNSASMIEESLPQKTLGTEQPNNIAKEVTDNGNEQKKHDLWNLSENIKLTTSLLSQLSMSASSYASDWTKAGVVALQIKGLLANIEALIEAAQAIQHISRSITEDILTASVELRNRMLQYKSDLQSCSDRSEDDNTALRRPSTIHKYTIPHVIKIADKYHSIIYPLRFRVEAESLMQEKKPTERIPWDDTVIAHALDGINSNYQSYLRGIANKVDKLISNDQIKKQFTEKTEQFVKMFYTWKAADPTDKPPYPIDWFKSHDEQTPEKPIRIPTEEERLMLCYVRLTTIHDLIRTTQQDTPIYFKQNYEGDPNPIEVATYLWARMAKITDTESIETEKGLTNKAMAAAKVDVAPLLKTDTQSVSGDNAGRTEQGTKPERDKNITGNISGMPWKKALLIAQEHVNEKGYPGQNELARIVGCAGATIKKAVDKDNYLSRARQKYEDKQKAKKELEEKTIALTKRVMAQVDVAQKTELSPSEGADTKAIIQYLIEQAEPKERAEINKMNQEQQELLVKTYYEQQKTHR